MADSEHLGAQFDEFSFRAGTSDKYGTTVVAYHNMNPVGSLEITPHDHKGRTNNQWRQRWMNDLGEQNPVQEVSEADVQIEQQLPGQLQWTGGAFDREDPSHVSWLGLDTRLGSRATTAKVLSRMMSLGVAHHGSVPRADFSLTPEGAAMSRGTARKYGMKPHPKNPGMVPNFDTFDSDDDTVPINARSHHYTLGHDTPTVRTYTAEEADALHRHVDAVTHVKKRRPDEETEPEAYAAWQERQERQSLRPGRGQMKLPGMEHL